MKLKEKITILFTKSELKKLFPLFIGILFMGFFEVVGVASVAPFIAVATSPEIIYENSFLAMAFQVTGVNNEIQFIFILGISVITLLLLSNSFQAFITWKMTSFTEMLNFRLSVRLLNKYLMKPYSFFLTRNTSDLGKNILNEVGRVTNGVIMQSLLLLSKIIISLFMLLLLLYLNPMVALTATLVIGGSYWLIFLIVKKRLHTIGLKATEATFFSFKAANEAMSGIKHIKLNGSEKEFVNRFYKPSERLANYRVQQRLIASLPRYLLEVIAFGGIILIIISIISISKGNAVDVIPLISIYAVAGYRLMPAIQQIYSGMTSIKFNLPALDNLIPDFTSPFAEKVKNTHQLILPFKNKLQINQLSFAYEDSEVSVLNKINLTIYQNTTVGLVGETGSGKTTLVDILLGLITPKTGSFTIDGVEINEQNKSDWQKNIGYVPQSIYLTDDTIEANIAFGCPNNEINFEKVIRAAELSKLDEFIDTLPEKYNTFVGERGVRLSGGQKQRIGIARALYNDPQVIFMDEATSSLDGITENVIMEAIHNLSQDKTIIMIAHRLSSIKDFDVIHLLKNGQVVDSGTFNDLMKKNEEFQRMASHL